MITAPTTRIVTEPSKIDDSLAELYRQTVGLDVSPGGVPALRTVLLNLIVYTSKPEEMEAISADVSGVMGTHPCRSIIIENGITDPSAKPASVSVVCGITDRGDRQLCGEIIELYVRGDEAGIVGSVMPLLTPDVPVFLWVQGEIPCSSDLFANVMDAATHVILDSRRFKDLEAGFDSMMTACTGGGHTRGIQDLAWLSIAPWREITAQHFDPPQTRSYLDKLEKLVVKFGPGEREDCPPSAPLLFTSWLTERLGVEVKSAARVEEGAFRIECDQNGHAVHIDLIPEERALGAGHIDAITIQCRGSEGTATFRIEGVSGSEISAEEECRGVCYPPRVLQIPPETQAALAAQALDMRLRDVVFESAVIKASNILDQLRS